MIAQLNTIAQLWWQWMGGMLWQVSLLIILVTAIDMAIRRWAWPQVRYVLWGLVFLKLVIPPTWQMPTSIVSWIQPLIEKQVSIQIEPLEATSGIFLEMDADALSLNRDDGSGFIGQISGKSVLLLSWIGGMVAFGIILFRRMFQLRKWHRRQESQSSPSLEIPDWFQKLLADTVTRLNLKKKPAVFFSSDTVSPAVYGLFHPTLLLPEGFFNRLSREEAEHVLIHELCHLKRGDLWVHWLCLVLQMVYWFNPLLIWTRRRMRHVCEICCDLSVADILREKTRFYRDTLIRTARDLFTETVEPGLGLLGVFEEPFRLVPRLQWLEKKTWEHRKRKTSATIITSLVMIAGVMPMAGLSQTSVQDKKLLAQYDSTPVESSNQISRQAQEALDEAQRRVETNHDNPAAARQPIVEFIAVPQPDPIPLVMYQMLGQLWYADTKADKHIEESQKIFEAGHLVYPDDEMLLLNYAVTTYELNRFLDAAPLFEKFYDVSLKHEVKYLSYAAAAYYTGGNRADAKRIFLKMLDMTENPDPSWLKSMITICSEMGALNEAVQYKAQLADLNSLNSENYDGVYNLDGVDEPPRLIRAFPPKYPQIAKAEKIEGRIVVELIVTKEGTPKNAWVIDAEPPDIFEEAALEAVRQYRFAPGTKNGEAVEVRVKLPIQFELGEDFQLDPEAEDIVGTVHELSEVDQPPRVLRAFPPKYPDIAKQDKIEGLVVLRFVVATDGKAKEPEVVAAVPVDVFESAALEMIPLYKFEPATMNGMSVNCIVKLPIAFKLEENDPSAPLPETISTFYFKDADIKDFIKFTENSTGKRYVIDDDVKGNLTLKSTERISIDELKALFESVLDKSGYAAVPSGGSVRIKKKGS